MRKLYLIAIKNGLINPEAIKDWQNDDRTLLQKIADEFRAPLFRDPTDSDVPQEAIYIAFKNAGYPEAWAQLAIAQSAHETGGWTSAIYKENNNLFGMKQPTERETTATGTARGHATFRSIQDSADDFILYLNARKAFTQKFSSPDQYVAWLKSKKYFEDSEKNYLTAVKKWFDKLFIPSDQFTVEEPYDSVDFWANWKP